LAQTPAATPAKPAAAAPKPAEAGTEAALRARVNEFFQYHVDGNFRKAMDMVAEETKDEYFATGKQQLKSFTLESVKLTDDDTKAVVTTVVKRDWQIRMQNNEVVVPMVTTWKVENGQWVWYHDTKGQWLTPMGPSNIEPPSKNADGTIKLPKSLGADVIAAAANSILGQSTISKSEVTLDPSKGPAAEKITFTNGVQGSVRVTVVGVPDLPGFKAEVAKADLGGGEQAQITVSYTPPSDDTPVPSSFTFQVLIEPLNQPFPIRVNFVQPDRQ